MNSSLILSWLWCVMQVGLISAIGVAISHVVRRRHPELAASATASAALTILGITALISVPLPTVSLPLAFPQAIDGQVSTDDGTNLSFDSTSKHSFGKASAVLIDLRTLLNTSFGFEEGNTESSQTGCRMFVGLAAVAISLSLLGLVKLLNSLRYIARLKRNSLPIDDRDANRMLSRLIEQLLVEPTISLRESRLVASAAVVGWRRPAIVFALEWQSWTHEQLRAVLAHELAHIKRRDVLWRLVASLTQALHFYHPPVHWLAQQLTLSQELAADRMAAEAIGSPAQYLKALSQLAMSRDDLSRFHMEPVVLSALSTNLMRRINMLRAKDCSHHTQTPFGLRGLATGFVIMVGAVTMMLRSSAEPSNSDSTSERAGQASQGVTPTDEPKTQGLFNRPPLDISLVGDNEVGAFAIRLGELSQRPDIRPLFISVNKTLSRWLHDDMGFDVAPELHIEAIDYLAGAFQLNIKPSTNPKFTSTMSYSSSKMIIRFREEIQWKRWIRKYVSDAQKKTEGKIDYFELSIPAFGPMPLLVSARDQRTVVMSFTFDDLQKLVDKDVVHQVNPVIASEWVSMDGGLMTFITTDRHVEASASSEDSPVKIAGSNLLNSIRNYSVGIDLREETNEFVLECNLACKDEASAKLTRESLALLMPAGIEKLAADMKENESTGPSGKFEPDYLRFQKNLIENFSTSVIQREDMSFAVEIKTAAEFPLQKLTIALAADPDGEVTK